MNISLSNSRDKLGKVYEGASKERGLERSEQPTKRKLPEKSRSQSKKLPLRSLSQSIKLCPDKYSLP
jgi:hypothetical protein